MLWKAREEGSSRHTFSIFMFSNNTSRFFPDELLSPARLVPRLLFEMIIEILSFSSPLWVFFLPASWFLIQYAREMEKWHWGKKRTASFISGFWLDVHAQNGGHRTLLLLKYCFVKLHHTHYSLLVWCQPFCRMITIHTLLMKIFRTVHKGFHLQAKKSAAMNLTHWEMHERRVFLFVLFLLPGFFFFTGTHKNATIPRFNLNWRMWHFFLYFLKVELEFVFGFLLHEHTKKTYIIN